MAAPGDYRWVEDVAVRPDDYDALGHVGNAAIARLLADARTDWFVSLGRRDRERSVVLVRWLAISYENEAPVGVRLRCGVRAVSRGTKSVTLDQLLWRADDGVAVAHGTAVHVCFDVPTRTSVPIWPAMLEAIEERQGAPLPVGDPRAAG